MTAQQLGWWHRFGVAIGDRDVRPELPADFIEGHETIHPGSRMWRNSAGRVLTVGGSGCRWWVAQVRPGGKLRSIDHLGDYESHADAQAALDSYARQMRMVEA